jgi:hypothetical protein
MLMRAACVAAAAGLAMVGAAAGQVSEAWVVRYGGPTDEYAWGQAVALDGQGDIVVAGGSAALAGGRGTDTSKWSPSGTLLWSRTRLVPGAALGTAFALTVDSHSNVYVTGSSEGVGGLDYSTIKYDATGVELWARTYNGPGNGWDQGLATAVDASGNVYVTGESFGSASNVDYATIKYDADGNELWVRRYNGPGNGSDFAGGVAVDAEGNVYVTGSSRGLVRNDCVTIKYDSQGNELWVRRHEAASSSRGTAIALDGSGHLYVGGAAGGYLLLKYGLDGTLVWSRTYGSSATVPLSGMVLDGQGNPHLAGRAIGPSTTADYLTLKYDAAGTLLWPAWYNGPASGNDQGEAIALDQFGNVYITGRSTGTSGGANNFDIATVRFNADGTLAWVMRYDGPDNLPDQGNSIVVDDHGAVYVAGSSQVISSNPPNSKMVLIKYVQDAPCYANCDQSSVQPVLNVDDFTCFINQYAAGASLAAAAQVGHYANCDGSTVAPALNVDDFTCFINRYAAGCR